MSVTSKTQSQTVIPPVADRHPHQFTLHGDTREDPYFWMRDRNDPEVRKYLEEENEYTDRMMQHTDALQNTLYQEMLARIQEDDTTVPYRKDDYWYYTRTEEGKAYRIYCRKKGSLQNDEEILLDVNLLAEGHDYTSLGALEVSPDHSLLAYSVDHTGAERHTLFIKDLETGEILDESIRNTYYSVVWANDNKTVFYNSVDETNRPDTLWRHKVGTVQDEDVAVVKEEDDRFYLSADRTRSDAYILVDLESAVTTEVLYLDADVPDGKFQTISGRTHEVEYYVDHHEDSFLVLTNQDAFNFRLLSIPVTQVNDSDALQEIVPHREDVFLDDVAAFRDFWVLDQREDGLTQLIIHDVKNNARHRIEMDDPTYTLWLDDNAEYETSTLRFGYESLVTPDSIYDYDMNTHTRELMKVHPVIGYEPSRYTSERLHATVRDGTHVPISVVYAKTTPIDGTAPLLLQGYGSYGYAYDPGFSSDDLSLLDRGFIIGIAHIRGGGEKGRRWKEDGKYEKKVNSFTDFIDVAEHLVANRYTARDRLAIYGRSAGGLLMGAVVNMRPDLFGLMVTEVPFVDVVTTMLDETIPLTVIEWEEWGNPNNETDYQVMKAYSPYDNVRAQDYPAMLITTSLNDMRVAYWEPAKWAARLRAMKTDNNVLLLKTDMGAGHGGKSGRYGRLEEQAFEYAFILDQLGID